MGIILYYILDDFQLRIRNILSKKLKIQKQNNVLRNVINRVHYDPSTLFVAMANVRVVF